MFREVCSEASAVDIVTQWQKTTLPQLLAQFEPRNIFNADETGIFFACCLKRHCAAIDDADDDEVDVEHTLPKFGDAIKAIEILQQYLEAIDSSENIQHKLVKLTLL